MTIIVAFCAVVQSIIITYYSISIVINLLNAFIFLNFAIIETVFLVKLSKLFRQYRCNKKLLTRLSNDMKNEVQPSYAEEGLLSLTSAEQKNIINKLCSERLMLFFFLLAKGLYSLLLFIL